MSSTNNDTSELFTQAVQFIPGGVNSPVRAFAAVGGNPIFINRAKGPYLWDTNDCRYIDYIGSWGPCILGHAHPVVVKAVTTAAQNGTSFGAATAAEIQLAKTIVERFPSIESIRLVNSGTEATMTAIRLARAYTKRDKIIKFAGCYHGHADSFLVQAGSGATTLGIPTSPGVPPAVAELTLIAEFNDIQSIKYLITEHPDEIAAVIIEPIVGNAGVIPPDKKFLSDLRTLTRDNDILLIFDEVMTGFRTAPAGAQQLYDITPDLTTLGKIIGGGLPIGAFGGRKDIMNLLAPAGPVYQAGTLSGNPLAVAAGQSTLDHLTNELYTNLEQLAAQLESGIRKNLTDLNLPWQYQRVASMACLFFTDRHVRNYTDAKTCDTNLFTKYFHNMLDADILLPPSQFEAFFLSTAHTPDLIEQTIAANRRALEKIQ